MAMYPPAAHLAAAAVCCSPAFRLLRALYGPSSETDRPPTARRVPTAPAATAARDCRIAVVGNTMWQGWLAFQDSKV